MKAPLSIVPPSVSLLCDTPLTTASRQFGELKNSSEAFSTNKLNMSI